MTREQEKHIKGLAGKLLNENLSSATFTKARAQKKIISCVAPAYLRRLISEHSTEIIQEMKSIENNRNSQLERCIS
jgi:hypothetical protein